MNASCVFLKCRPPFSTSENMETIPREHLVGPDLSPQSDQSNPCPTPNLRIHRPSLHALETDVSLSAASLLSNNASMQLSRLIFLVALLLAPIALFGTTWLYLYPLFHGCAFPKPPSTHTNTIAPFRLLALGDPQLEGDSSLPDPLAPVFPSLNDFLLKLEVASDNAFRLEIVKDATKGVVRDVGRWLEGKRKTIDLWGNDWYLAHIVRTLRWWTGPSHVAVLGDLLGSQWITDGEFEKRAGRYWGIVMRGLERVPGWVYGEMEEDINKEEREVVQEGDGMAKEDEGIEAENDQGEKTDGSEVTEDHEEVEQEAHEDDEQEGDEENPPRKPSWGGTTEVLGADKSWETRVINIAGNHDVGYAGDLDASRIDRFEKAFGSVNWDIWFTLPTNTSDADSDPPPALRLVILNSMNMDTPAWDHELQTETYSFMNHIITSSRDVTDKTHATILLTHIPLEKQAGICVDSPMFDFFEGGHGVKEQNMLSDFSSKTVLQGIFGMSASTYAAASGMGRRGVIINGHDHAGCDVVHFIKQDGVEDACIVDEVNREDAYWPDPSSTPTKEAVSQKTSSVDAVNPFVDATSPAQIPEPQADPEPDPALGWRAHRFPHRLYSITHDAAKNTTCCTSIADSPRIREITLRSMMGEFSGYAGFLSAWFDTSAGEKGEWVIEFSTCGVGVQHWWWAVHSFDFSFLVFLVAGAVAAWVEKRERAVGKKEEGKMGNGQEKKENGGVVHTNGVKVL
jgi:hypothetical protein